MDDDDPWYPDWLYIKLIEDTLPWDKKSEHSLESFLKKYTLHDSYWVGAFHHVAFDKSVTLAFQWDSLIEKYANRLIGKLITNLSERKLTVACGLLVC